MAGWRSFHPRKSAARELRADLSRGAKGEGCVLDDRIGFGRRVDARRDLDRRLLALGVGGPREALLWEKKITSPPTTLDKLGVSASSEVWELGALPDTLLADLDRVAPRARHRAGSWFADRVAGPIEGVLLISVTTQRDLEIIATISTAIADTAAVWILYPRGVRVVTENDVRRAGITAGLVDNKTAKITDSVTSLRFVRPKSARASARR